MKINYSDKSSFSNNPEELNASDCISIDLNKNITDSETFDSEKKINTDDLPYTPKISLSSKKDFNESLPLESSKTNETQEKSNENAFLIKKSEIVDLNEEIWDKYYFALAQNWEQLISEEWKDTHEEPKELQVKLLDFKNSENNSLKEMEDATKAHEYGIGLLFPKNNKNQKVLAQENLSNELKKHNISVVKAIMPSGETRVFRNIKFQTITGSTSSTLTRAFNQLTVVIENRKAEERRKKELEEQQEKSKRLQESLRREAINKEQRIEKPLKTQKTDLDKQERKSHQAIDNETQEEIKLEEQQKINETRKEKKRLAALEERRTKETKRITSEERKFDEKKVHNKDISIKSQEIKRFKR